MPKTPTVDVFLIDPPWPKKRGGVRHIDRKQRQDQSGRVSRELDYETMPVPDIFNLLDQQCFRFASTQHVVFLWGIDQFLIEGEKSMMDRGYRLHARMIWDKNNGIAPAFSVRYCHEYLTWFYKPKFTPVSVGSRGKTSSVFRESAREHSRKPECVYEAIQQWFPDLTKMDVFSRQKRNGWLQFGNQTDHFN